MADDGESREWSWEQAQGHCYVKLQDDMQLEWGGWDNHPKGGGGATSQGASEYLQSGRPGYDWMRVPQAIAVQLRGAIEIRFEAQNRPLKPSAKKRNPGRRRGRCGRRGRGKPESA